MSKSLCFGVVALPLILGLFSTPLQAQGTAPQNAPQPAPATQPVVISQPPPPKEPFVLDDGGLYIQPIYWLNRAQPSLRGGKTAASFSDFDYTGNAKASIGAEIGVPAGRSNTLRLSYFRVQGNSGATLGQNTTIFNQGYLANDFINATYKTQAVKISWDYLSYSWHKPSTTIRLKTLYEVQYVTTKIATAAPFKSSTADASGNVNDNTASGSKSVVLPTFGMAIGSTFGKYFRWDVRGSGFGLPHRSVIGDAQASIAVRLGKVELVAGERIFYFKTSPRGDLFLTDTLQGVFGGLRIAWKGKL